MENLNFPGYSFRFKNKENKSLIFDVIRKKFVVFQPEEWVRQHVLHYLMTEKKYPPGLINVEKQIKVNSLPKRVDIVVFTPQGELEILVECKAPEVKITKNTFDQIARYNMDLRARYLMVTNGINHYFCQMDYNRSAYIFLEELPSYSGEGI
ncbi:type I restriction enzyme HsdR N-terminal domain-containing protein [Muriicola soli]|uniref:Type I restriction enzyme HsdR N-terminal domain-containing protein n=1 Tax=Muriicola soli TaxID=2507538 RepID=A0A411E955_9FLAO|nr:type I restriction enzyme HsdR N-terminal domain-containing protein [Muriicola soli]QBA64097.1 type I restriction enzyme HsdR N-terminal domain-containing protein [Muriicola soli]